MSNNHLPTGWANQPTNAPKGWGKTPEQKKNNPFAPVAAKEENEHKEPEPIAEQSDNIITDNSDDIVPAEQEADAAEYNDSFDNTVSQKETEKEDKSAPQTQTAEKKPKTIRASTVVLLILLTVALCCLAIFAILFFRDSGNERGAEEQQAVETTATLAPTELATQVFTEEPTSTEPPTEKETAEPTTVEKATESENNDDNESDFERYLIDVVNYVNYYESPDFNSRVTGQFTELTKYTIVDEAYDNYGSLWGKLKSGVGWVNIEDATDIHYTSRVAAARRAYLNSPYKKYKNVGDVVFCYDPVFPIDEMSPADDSYHDKINFLTVEQLGSNSFELHIKGEFQTNDGVAERLCCWEMDSNFHLLNTHDLSEPILNEDFNIDTAIGIGENTKIIYIGFDYTARLM